MQHISSFFQTKKGNFEVTLFLYYKTEKENEQVRFSFFKFKTEILRFLVNHIDTINNLIKKQQERRKIARQIL